MEGTVALAGASERRPQHRLHFLLKAHEIPSPAPYGNWTR